MNQMPKIIKSTTLINLKELDNQLEVGGQLILDELIKHRIPTVLITPTKVTLETTLKKGINSSLDNNILTQKSSFCPKLENMDGFSLPTSALKFINKNSTKLINRVNAAVFTTTPLKKGEIIAKIYSLQELAYTTEVEHKYIIENNTENPRKITEKESKYLFKRTIESGYYEFKVKKLKDVTENITLDQLYIPKIHIKAIADYFFADFYPPDAHFFEEANKNWSNFMIRDIQSSCKHYTELFLKPKMRYNFPNKTDKELIRIMRKMFAFWFKNRWQGKRGVTSDLYNQAGNIVIPPPSVNINNDFYDDSFNEKTYNNELLKIIITSTRRRRENMDEYNNSKDFYQLLSQHGMKHKELQKAIYSIIKTPETPIK